jgi:hypothetical protein
VLNISAVQSKLNNYLMNNKTYKKLNVTDKLNSLIKLKRVILLSFLIIEIKTSRRKKNECLFKFTAYYLQGHLMT